MSEVPVQIEIVKRLAKKVVRYSGRTIIFGKSATFDAMIPDYSSRKIRKKNTKQKERSKKVQQQQQQQQSKQEKQAAAEVTTVVTMGQIMQQEEIEYSSEHQNQQRSSSSSSSTTTTTMDMLPKVPSRSSRCGSLSSQIMEDLMMNNNDYDDFDNEFADYEKDLNDDYPLLASSSASFSFDFEEEAEAVISGRRHRRSSNTTTRSSFRSTKSNSNNPSRNPSISTASASSVSSLPYGQQQQSQQQDNSSFASQSWADCSMPSLVSFCHDSFGSMVSTSGGSSDGRGYGNQGVDLDTSHSFVDLSSVLEELENLDLTLAQTTPTQQPQLSKQQQDPRWQPVQRCRSADNFDCDLFSLSNEDATDGKDKDNTRRKAPKRAHSTTSILSPKCASYVPDVMTLRESRWQCVTSSSNIHERRSDSTLSYQNTPPRMPRGSYSNKSEQVASTTAATQIQSDSMLFNCSPPSRRPISPSKSRWQ